ncbi:MFS transporter [Streptomyces sp. NPDC057675]|uniref:MFS transporter n=1 Tax=Streptomyces sp. NPDC057675 TaxID=3346204 RepID=UPI0036938E39
MCLACQALTSERSKNLASSYPVDAHDVGGQSAYAWVITAYVVPATVTLPVYTRLSDRYGRRLLLVVGMLIFLAGSAACAGAQSMGQLIAFRAVQGLGAGALEGLSFLLVSDLHTGQRRSSAQGAMAGLMALSFLGGPLVGGFLTDTVGWRSTFLVNLPIGIAALCVILRVLPAELGRNESRRIPLDLLGISVLVLAVGSILQGLDSSTRSEDWTSLGSLGALGLGCALLFVFVRVEKRAPAPLVPPGLLFSRRVAALLASGTASAFTLFSCILLLPPYFQHQKGVDATHSGLLIYPLLVGLLLSVNGGAAFIVRGGKDGQDGRLRTAMLTGYGLVALGALGFSQFTAGTPDWQAALYMALIGVGSGPAFSGLQITVQGAVAPRDMGAAVGTLLLGRQVGGSVALALASSIYTAQLASTGSSAAATGRAIWVVAGVGAVLAAGALMTLPSLGRRSPLRPSDREEPV